MVTFLRGRKKRKKLNQREIRVRENTAKNRKSTVSRIDENERRYDEKKIRYNASCVISEGLHPLFRQAIKLGA